MKDKNSPLYNPLQANKVCIYGQLLLLDLIEHLENSCKIIQSNTDGILIKLTNYRDYDLIKNICYEWEKRTGLILEFEEFKKIFQKDVNNYILIDKDGNYKSKGRYTKKLNDLDYDLPIINKALVNYFVNEISVENTINNCNELKEFQMICKITSKYSFIMHGEEKFKEKCIRVFASKNKKDLNISKFHKQRKNLVKIPNSPENCFINNGNINKLDIIEKLDKQWYINFAKKILNDFGVCNYV